MNDKRTSASSDNQIFLRGRLAAPAAIRSLPSGDELCTFRVTVRRPRGSRSPVDSIDCSTIKPRIQRAVESAEPGTELELTGSLHRRFWRTPAGPASRYEVAVATVRVRSRQRTGASPGRTRASA